MQKKTCRQGVEPGKFSKFLEKDEKCLVAHLDISKIIAYNTNVKAIFIMSGPLVPEKVLGTAEGGKINVGNPCEGKRVAGKRSEAV